MMGLYLVEGGDEIKGGGGKPFMRRKKFLAKRFSRGVDRFVKKKKWAEIKN